MSQSDDVRQKLKNIITTFGREVVDHSQRCEGLLRDFIGSHRIQLNLLLLSLKEGIPSRLLNESPSLPKQGIFNQFKKHLQDNHGLTDYSAYWAVETWLYALGKISENELIQREYNFEERLDKMDRGNCTLSVTTNKEAQIIKNGEKLGKTKNCYFDIRHLLPGKYEIKARTKYDECTKIVHLKSEEPIEKIQLNLRPQKTVIYAISRIGSYKMTVDGKTFDCPGKITDVETGKKQVKINFKGQEFEEVLDLLLDSEYQYDLMDERITMARDENKAENIDDWIRLAVKWKTVFRDEKKVRFCMEEAKKKVKFVREMKKIAKAYKEKFNREDEARHYILEMEKTAKDRREMRLIARVWEQVLNDEAEFNRCWSEADKFLKIKR